MKILKTIFGDGAGKLVESVGGVLDNLSTSKEEKLEAKRKIKELMVNHQVVLPFKYNKNGLTFYN